MGFESAAYNLSYVLFGHGITPTALLTLNDVELKHYYPYYREFRRITPHHILQASQEVMGISLELFLKKGLPFSNLCRESFSEQILLSMLLNASDRTPNKFIIHEELGKPDKIIGIDNDMAFGPSIVQTKIKGNLKHSLEVKNILYCLPLMEETIPGIIRKRLLSLSPEHFILQWLAHLQIQDEQYRQLERSSYLSKNKRTSYFSFAYCCSIKFAPDFISGIIRRLSQIQSQLQDHPVTTHMQLFYLLDPLTARFYQTVQAVSDSILDVFKKIYHSNQDNLSLEEVLKTQRDTLLPSGKTVAQVLEAETHPTPTARAWTQTVEEETKQLLRRLDLETQSSIAPLIDIVATAFSHLSQYPHAFHPSWHQGSVLFRALQEQVSPQGIEFLLRLGLDARFRHPKTQQTAFHVAAQEQYDRTVFELLSQGLSAEEQKAFFNSKDCLNRTPLDEILLNQPSSTFIDLIHLGASDYSPMLALKFYQNLLQYKSSLQVELRAAFQHLMTVNLEVDWQIALKELLPPFTKRKDPAAMSIHLSDYGVRRLPQSIKDQLSDVEGFAQQGNHLTGCVQGQGALKQHYLYFNVYPALPSLEEASGSLMRQLLGFGAPYTDLAKIGTTPVLIRQGISGPTLLKVLQENRDLLKDLVEEDISGIILAAMLINPEDGKPENYIVTPHPTQRGKYRLVGIDNAQAFVPVFVKE